MTKVYFIRHAEAEGNLYRRIHGHYDSLVTFRGKKQIARLEKRFEPVKLDAVYSSDLTRTRATAAAVYKKKGLPFYTTPELREVAMGDWEDRTWGEVERFEPEKLDWFNNDPSRWRVPGAEYFDDLQSRLTEAVRSIAGDNQGKTIALVTHGSALRAFTAGVMGIPPQEIRRIPHCDNTSVSLLDIDGGRMTFEYYGDNSHLPEELSTFAHQRWWRENTTFDSSNLRFVPFDLDKDAGLYLKYREDAWALNGNGTENPAECLEKAKAHARAHPRGVSLALIGDTPVGMIELAAREAEGDGAGIVEYFCMVPEQRRMGIAVQLLGEAVSVYRSLGRKKLRLSVSQNNEDARSFCLRYSFEKTGETRGPDGLHDVMELDIDLARAGMEQETQ